MSENLFCEYVISEIGAKCLMYLGQSSSAKFCKRHLKKPPKQFTHKGIKFRGDSSWQKENGFFNNK